jgi:DNA sulfur modification protein DndE
MLNRIILFIALVFAFTSEAQTKNEQYYISKAPFKMPAVVEPHFPQRSFSIRDYGAIGDGQTLNTAAFAKAIEACVKAGGGKVIVPAGLWLTGPIELQSNLNLVVERGALIQFTPDRSQYPIIQMKGSNNYQVAPPVYGSRLKNVAITGEGILDGAGESWRPLKKSKATEAQWKEFTKTGVVSKDGSLWWPSKEAMEGEAYLKKLKQEKSDAKAEDYLPARDFMRPKMVVINNSEKILVEGVTLRNSPQFVFNPGNCTNLTLRHVNVFNEWWAQNGDGIDISACKNVLIYKCNVSAGDDGICMKSSGGKDDKEARLENVVIAGCNVYHAHGGFVIGSNTDGGMNNIFVTDCNFIGTDIGIRVKSNAGRGGLVHNIYVKDIYMSNIVDDAISFDTYYEDVPAGRERSEVGTTLRDKTPIFKDFYISNIYCRGANTAISITGLPEMPVQKIYFENMTISANKGYEAKDAKDISFKNVKFILPNGKVVNYASNSSSSSNNLLESLPLKPHNSINQKEFDRQYRANKPLWDKTFEFLRTTDLGKLEKGDYPLAGDSAVVKVTYGPAREEKDAKWEAHKKFIDVQLVGEGKEKIGVAEVSKATIVTPYNDSKDVANYEAVGCYYVAEPGTFFIFFPSDAHRPGIKLDNNNVRKIVVKILAAE